MDYGFRISKTGYNVLNESDERNLIMTSKRNSLKEIISGTTSITTNGSGSGSTSVVHNLGYVPHYFSFSKADDRWYANQSGYTGLQSKIDASSIYFSITGKDPSTTYSIFYIIFADQIV